MVTKSRAKAKMNEAKVQETGAKAKTRGAKGAKGTKVRSKAKALAGAMAVEIDPERAGALARLYAWLATDLRDWQTNNDVGEESEGDCPVIVQIHNEACRKLHDEDIDLPTAAAAATTILSENTQNKSYIDPVTDEPFQFLEAEIEALTVLTMSERLIALAPYIPLGALEMW